MLLVVKKVFGLAALGDVNFAESWPVRQAPLWAWTITFVLFALVVAVFVALRAPQRWGLLCCVLGTWFLAIWSQTVPGGQFDRAPAPRDRQSLLRTGDRCDLSPRAARHEPAAAPGTRRHDGCDPPAGGDRERLPLRAAWPRGVEQVRSVRRRFAADVHGRDPSQLGVRDQGPSVGRVPVARPPRAAPRLAPGSSAPTCRSRSSRQGRGVLRVVGRRGQRRAPCGIAYIYSPRRVFRGTFDR